MELPGNNVNSNPNITQTNNITPLSKILITVLLIILPIFTFFLGIEYQKRITKTPIYYSITQVPTATPFVTAVPPEYATCPSTELTEETTGIKFTCSRGWKMQKLSSNRYQFRLTTDNTPAISGFALSIHANPENLTISQVCDSSTDMIKTAFIYLCSDIYKESSTLTRINNIEWEKFDDNIIGIEPTGFVVYSAVINNHLVAIEDYSSEPETIAKFVESITLSK